MLRIYKLTNGQGQISDDLTYSNPIVWEASPLGGVLEMKLYLRMDAGEYCTSGILFAVDAAGEDESSWFEFAPDESGAGEYESTFEFEIPLGAEVPVWIKLTLPSGVEAEPKDDIRIRASYIGHTTED